MSKSIKRSFGNTNTILKHNDFTATTTLFADTGIVANDEGKKIIPAGTIWPANDATAQGVILNDVDVTYGNENGALVLHGFINTAKLPETPTAEAKAALTQISFL